MNIFKNIFLILILATISFPNFQKSFIPDTSKPLSGAFQNSVPPVFSCSTWFNRTYQEQYAKNINDSIGLRSYFVRFFNQIDFSIFSIMHAEGMIEGKNSEMFPAKYTNGYLGIDFPGDKIVDEKIRMLKVVQDILWTTRKIFICVVIPPEKVTFCIESVPEHLLKGWRHESSRSYFYRKAVKAGVNVIDFMPYFMAMKDTSRYPLFPTTGMHWSDYGAYLAADSALKYFTKQTGFYFPQLVVDSLVVTSKARHDDDDINKALNLFWDAPHADLAYPVFHTTGDRTKQKPAMLCVGDSFFWAWWNQGIIDSLFRNREFWYYAIEVFPESSTKIKGVSELNLRESVLRQDIVMLFQVGAGGGNPGAGIIDRLYAEFDTSGNNEIRRIEKSIRNSKEWLAAIMKKANEQHILVDDLIRTEAITAFNDEIKNK
jgi:hypothetical protein